MRVKETLGQTRAQSPCDTNPDDNSPRAEVAPRGRCEDVHPLCQLTGALLLVAEEILLVPQLRAAGMTKLWWSLPFKFSGLRDLLGWCQVMGFIQAWQVPESLQLGLSRADLLQFHQCTDLEEETIELISQLKFNQCCAQLKSLNQHNRL